MRKQHDTSKSSKDFNRRTEGDQRVNRDAISGDTEKSRGRSGASTDKSSKRSVDDAPAE